MNTGNSFQVFDGGGEGTDSTTSSPRRTQWVTGKLPVGHRSNQERQEAETSLRIQTTAESAGEKQLRPEDGGLQIEMYNRGNVPSALMATMGPADEESKETLGPDKKERAPSESPHVFKGIPQGLTTRNVLHPQQVQSPDDSLAPDEAVALATTNLAWGSNEVLDEVSMESQALLWGLDEGSYKTLNELVFPQAACVNGRQLSCSEYWHDGAGR